jgi:hypothetical protein
MKTGNALWSSLVSHSVRLSKRAVLLALLAFALFTAVGCNPGGGTPPPPPPHESVSPPQQVTGSF